MCWICLKLRVLPLFRTLSYLNLSEALAKIINYTNFYAPTLKTYGASMNIHNTGQRHSNSFLPTMLHG